MRPIASKEYVAQLLSGMELTGSTLDTLISTCHKEDLYIDYKAGAIFEDNTKNPPQILREYVSAFANSDGGAIIFGVTDGTSRTVDGCRPPGGRPPNNWAADCLKPIASYLSPSPRIHTVNHPNGEVLVVATQRAPTFVPCIESGTLVYYIRVGDQTISCPPYLISDLLLGRRQTPTLTVSVNRVTAQSMSENRVSFSFEFSVTNTGLVPAEAVKVGFVYYSSLNTHLTVPETIYRYVDTPLEPIESFGVCHFCTSYKHNSKNLGFLFDVDPLETKHGFYIGVGLVVPYFDLPSEINAAIYVLPKNSVPLWYQFSYQYSEIDAKVEMEVQERKIVISPTWNERPKVSWRKRV